MLKKINTLIETNKISGTESAALVINLSNLLKNYTYLKSFNKKTEIASSIKANAYGLGAIKIAKTLNKIGCKNFFVATSAEALALKKEIKKINIFVLNGSLDEKTSLKLIDEEIYIVVNNFVELDLIKRIAIAKGNKIKCALHFDSGINRLGFPFEDIDKISNAYMKYMNIVLVMTHLTCSEKKASKFNVNQLNIFKKIKYQLSYLKNCKFSISNSNGALINSNYYFDMIRAGGYIYGLSLTKKKISSMKTIVSLKAKIIQIRCVDKLNPIGYGASYITKRKSLIATLGIGYADGIPRSYKGYVFLKKQKAPIVGNISMDLMTIDITKIKNVKINDWVEIFGKNIIIEKFASQCNTISYEITSKISKRVQRVYIT